MASKSVLNRGFKTNSEKLAIEYRNKLSIHACGPLSAFDLATHLEIPVYDAIDFIESQDEKDMLSKEDCGWSALTMITNAGNRIIIHNTYHSPARQQSNLMHELAHIICGHKKPNVDYGFVIPLGMRDYNELQEEEAKCLGAILQITRPGLLWALKRNLTISEIADYFYASSEMVSYRIYTSGVAKQNNYRKKISA